MVIKCSVCTSFLKKTNIEQTQCFYCTESACMHCDNDYVCSQCRNGYTLAGGRCTLTQW